eukprot:TRINITY_DN10768_c0_g1_i2.p1 TRINITY_DN10768_c0_g1~~TRINITY_DN10768_c0_g1_i2.p1  ORF type:complete len:249 (+),score=74.29 TRINITY_DN10768_c0_g1_i2:96-749(+)
MGIRAWILFSGPGLVKDTTDETFANSDRTLRFSLAFDNTRLKDFALEMVISLVKHIEEEKPERLGGEHFDILQFSFRHLDFTKISADEMNFIANNLKDYLCVALCDEDFYALSTEILKVLLRLHFKQELQMKDVESFLSSALILMKQNNLPKCLESIATYLVDLKREALESNFDAVKRFLSTVVVETRSKLGEEAPDDELRLTELLDRIDVLPSQSP